MKLYFAASILLLFTTISALSQDSIALSMLNAVNAVRIAGCQCGSQKMPSVSPLKWNAKLEMAAIRQVKYISAKGILTHEGSYRSEVSNRVDEVGYKWTSVGENIAGGYTSVRAVVNCWIESPPHCLNMMNGTFKEMGAANKGEYWVQVFSKDN
jgi:uncharacterized protein YkwD